MKVLKHPLKKRMCYSQKQKIVKKTKTKKKPDKTLERFQKERREGRNMPSLEYLVCLIRIGMSVQVPLVLAHVSISWCMAS